MSDVDDAWAQHLLRLTEERMEGQRLSDEEAARMHQEAMEFAWAESLKRDEEEQP